MGSSNLGSGRVGHRRGGGAAVLVPLGRAFRDRVTHSGGGGPGTPELAAPPALCGLMFLLLDGH